MAFDKTKFLSQFREEVLERLETVTCNLVELEKYPGNMEVYETVKREFHTLKGITSLMGFNKTSEMFHKLEDLFRTSNNIDKDFDCNVYDFIFKCTDIVKTVFHKNEVLEDSIAEFVDVHVAKFMADISLNSGIVEDCSLNTEKIEKDKDQQKPISRSFKPELSEETDKVKVEASQLSDLINFSNEIHMAKSMLKDSLIKLDSNISEGKIVNTDEFYSSFNRLTVIYEKLDRFSGAISRLAVNMRMVSLDTLFNLYIRPVREMAKEFGVEVNLKFDGEKTLLDKDVLKYIIDPVLHILRNAIDHGIESPFERLNNNKPKFGTILFRAYQRNSKVFIEISDDGRGVDLKKLKNKIFQKGLAGLKEVNMLSEDKLLKFLFYHGFSTKDTVNLMSGRGVGLDVVKEKLEAINGAVRISSKQQVGTTITLILPLTLSITESLLVEAGTEVFAIPTDYVKEVRRLEPCYIETTDKKLLGCRLNNKLVPAVNLCKYLKIKKKYLLDSCKLAHVVVVYSGNHLYCIIVDKILTYADTVIKPVLSVKNQFKAFLGGTVTGDGRAVLVLDIPALIMAEPINDNISIQKEESTVKTDCKNLKVLVAEDSVNIAAIEKNILEAVGFNVSIAPDGKTAYDMALNDQYDIILSDVLMPGINGIEFVKLIRGVSYYAQTPIIMVTSRNKPEDKLNAFAAGANEYILKAELTSDNIIALINKYFKT